MCDGDIVAVLQDERALETMVMLARGTVNTLPWSAHFKLLSGNLSVMSILPQFKKMGEMYVDKGSGT